MTTSTTDSRSVSSSVAYLERLARGSVAPARGDALQTMSSTATAERPVLRSVDYLEQLARTSERAAEGEQEPAPPTEPAHRKSRRPEIHLLALVALVCYAVFGWWLKYTYNFSLGDALARTSDAKSIVWSRDPHFASIGLYWMPLPTLAQVPVMTFLQPLGRPEFAGPLSTAFFGAGTVFALGRIAARLDVGRLFGFLLALAFAVNPMVAYYAANGMGEMCEVFFAVLTLGGLLRYLKDDSIAALVGTGLALAGLALSKYEAVPAVAVVAVAVALVRLRRTKHDLYPRFRRTALDLVVAVGPAVLAVLLWLCYMRTIAGSFMAFREVGSTTQEGIAVAVQPGEIGAAIGELERTVAFVGRYVLSFFPALFVLPLLAVGSWRRLLGAAAALALGLSLIAGSSYLIYKGGTYGNARYFMPLVAAGAVVLVGLAASAPWHTMRRVVLSWVALAFAVLSCFTVVVGELEAQESVEREKRVFSLLVGRYNDQPRYEEPNTDFSGLFRETASALDVLIKPGDRVLLDTRFTGQVFLHADNSRQFIINADRDYEVVASPNGIDARIDYAVVPPAQGITGLPGERDDAYMLVRRQEGWSKVFDSPVAEIWKRADEAKTGTIRPPRG